MQRSVSPGSRRKSLPSGRRTRSSTAASNRARRTSLFIVYEGPPTANARPGIHHVLSRVFKDLIPRYKTMQGYRVPRKGGWDTHGLPVELEIEKELGLKSKPEIEAYGIAAFNEKCKAVRLPLRRRVDPPQRAHRLLGGLRTTPTSPGTTSYIETCWWIFKQLWDARPRLPGLPRHAPLPALRHQPQRPRGLARLRGRHPGPERVREVPRRPGEALRRARPSAPYAVRRAAPISLVAWTTTPWTLPGNVALAVKEDADYGIYAATAMTLSSWPKTSPRRVLGERRRRRSPAVHGDAPGRPAATNRSTGPRMLGLEVRRFDAEGRLRRVRRRATSHRRRSAASSPPTTSRSTTAPASSTSRPPSAPRTSSEGKQLRPALRAAGRPARC